MYPPTPLPLLRTHSRVSRRQRVGSRRSGKGFPSCVVGTCASRSAPEPRLHHAAPPACIMCASRPTPARPCTRLSAAAARQAVPAGPRGAAVEGVRHGPPAPQRAPGVRGVPRCLATAAPKAGRWCSEAYRRRRRRSRRSRPRSCRRWLRTLSRLARHVCTCVHGFHCHRLCCDRCGGCFGWRRRRGGDGSLPSRPCRCRQGRCRRDPHIARRPRSCRRDRCRRSPCGCLRHRCDVYDVCGVGAGRSSWRRRSGRRLCRGGAAGVGAARAVGTSTPTTALQAVSNGGQGP